MEAKSPSIGFPLMGKYKSGSRESWRKVPAPKSDNSVTNTLQVHPDLGTMAKTDDSSIGPNLCRVGWKRVQRVGQLFSLRLMLNERECSTQQRWHPWYGRMTHQGVLGVVLLPPPHPAGPSLEPIILDAPQENLIHSALSLPNPRLSGCK